MEKENKKYCIFFEFKLYDVSISYHGTTNHIGSSFARELIEVLLQKITSIDEKNYLKSLLTLSPSNKDIQKCCLCSVFNLKDDCEMKGAGKPLEYEVGNILFSERSKILEKMYSPSLV